MFGDKTTGLEISEKVWSWNVDDLGLGLRKSETSSHQIDQQRRPVRADASQQNSDLSVKVWKDGWGTEEKSYSPDQG